MRGMIDIHCHLLPKVDDGARSMKEALRMLQIEEADGVSAVIITPHFRAGMFETPEAKIEGTFIKLQEEALKAGLKIRIFPGCEYHASSGMVDDFLNGRRLTLAGSWYVLAEFSGADRYSVITQRISELISAGFHPVIAHAERIECLRREYGRFQELIRMGAEIQITAGTLLGEDGWSIGHICRKMIKDGSVRYIASDAHRVRERRPNLRECFDFLVKKYGQETAEELLIVNPRKILSKDNKFYG